MPGPSDPAILPRSDLTLHHARPTTPSRPHTITRPLLKECQGWVNSFDRLRALNDGSHWTEDSSHTMATPQHDKPRSRDTWHGWSPDSSFSPTSSSNSRFSSTWSRDYRFNSTRSRDFRFSSTRSHDPRQYSIRSRASLNSSVRSRSSLRSVASRASSTLRRSLRRTEPLYRAASSRARVAKEWAGTLSQRVTGKGGTLLLTPAGHRRQPVVVAAHGSPTPGPARNSPRIQATRRAASAARTIHWEVASGLAALFECGASASSVAAVGVGRVCTAAAAMADGKLQQVRRSISSWSLSTIKKPKITIPRLKTPKVKIFRGGKKNRVDPNIEAGALEEVKAALLKAEDDGGNQGEGAAADEVGSEVIHEPSAGGPQEGQPTIVLTVHEHKNPPEPPSPPPSPGLLAVKDDIEFIDSDEGDNDNKVIEAVRADLDYSDQWFDASGTLTRSKENVAEAFNDFDDGQESKYYDFVDNTVQKQEELEALSKDKPKGGSQKAREWVKSFDEKSESRIQKWLKMNRTKSPSNLPKSKSEIRLDKIDDPSDKWSKRDEIKLNTLNKNESQTRFLQNVDSKLEENKNKRESEKEKSTRKESLKKIFQVRGKLSLKPIVDSPRPTYRDTDIHIAATPYALANTAGASRNRESLDISEDGINCTTDDLDLAGEVGVTTSNLQQQHDTPNTSSSPSEKQEVSEAADRSKAPVDQDMAICSQSVSEKQLEERVVEKEIINDKETFHPPLSHDASTDINARNQVECKQEVIGDNVASLSKAHDVCVKNSAVDAISNTLENHDKSAENHDKSAEVINGVETESKPKENSIELPVIGNTETDENTGMKADIQGSQHKEERDADALQEKGAAETCKPEEEGEQPSMAQGPKGENKAVASPEARTKETKKKRLSGTNFPKPLRSVFTQQMGSRGKAETKEGDSGEKKKKRGKINPFKVSIKDKVEAMKERGRTPSSAKDKQVHSKTKEEEPTGEKNLIPPEGDKGVTLSDEVSNLVSGRNSSVGTEKGSDAPPEDSAPDKATQGPLDILTSNGISLADRSHSASPVSLEYVSQVDSDEMKTVSHESSPEMETSFVEENGLRLRKDALLAIKSMEVDDTTTHYYSFHSASEDFQTPMRDEEDLQPTASAKMLPNISADLSLLEAKAGSTAINEVERVNEKITEGREELPQQLAEFLTRDDGPEANTSQANQADAEKENLQGTEEELNKNVEDLISQVVINDPSTTVPEVALQQDTPPAYAPERTISEDVPRLKLGPSAPFESQEAPKPSPRSKKGRYGYSTVTGIIAPPGTPRGTTPSTQEPSVSDYSEHGPNDSPTTAIDNTLTATYPRRTLATKKGSANELEKTPSESGYSGAGTSYSGGSDAEPIYWEISEQREAPPKPSPRTKKNQKASSHETSNQNRTARQASSNTTVKEESQRKPLPEWINTRAPIPSPRGKKQLSLQSLPSVVPAYDTMESVKKKLQLLSHEPLPSIVIPQPVPIMTKKEEDQFYSGKAASISYGFTPTKVAPPSPPLRIRKASQVSLPVAMAAEEAQCRQLKRRSIYVSPDGKTAPQPPSPRRARRRTDPTQGTAIRDIKSAVKAEELLADVLYSAYSLMGDKAGGVWKVGGEGDFGGPTTRSEVHMEQLVAMLQGAFQVSQETIDRLWADVQNRPAPEVNLQLNVKEARDLRQKTVKGTANPYVIVSLPSSGTSHRTRLEKDTLWPKWNQEFTLPISNFQKEVLRLEVWHEHEAVSVRHALTAVRDIKGVSRLVKGTTAHVQNQTSHLLGHVVVSVKDVVERGADGWFTLEKNEERSKERGSIHLVGTVTSKAQLENKSRHSYDALLARLVHHQLAATNNNNEHCEWSTPWNGHLSGPGAASLAQHAIMLDLSDAAIQLAWWKVGSTVTTADAAWILSRLQSVQAAISKTLYTDDELLELRSSFYSYIHEHTEQLKDLHKAFPPSSGVIAKRQLSFTLKAMQCMQNHTGTRALLDLEGLPHLQELVSSSLATHAKNWWTAVIDELRGARTTDEQICHVINIVKECHTFLAIAANTYNAIFMKEMNIPYMQTTYLMVSKKVDPCVRPLVMNIYNRLPTTEDQEEEDADCEYRMEVGTSLWELYMNLGRLHQLGESLPAEARAESGVREYHRWFSRGVLRWLDLARCRARNMIKKAVELDMLEPQDNYCKFSSSASDALGIFNDVRIWWQRLAWPDPENSAVVLTKILEDICSCVLTYSNLIQEKVECIFHQQENSTRAFITEQICVGLNNIERIRTEMVKLPTQFGFQDLLQNIRAAGSGDSAAAQLEATVDRLIVNAAENMEAKVNEFIDAVLEKMQPTLERAVNEACEAQSSRPLLAQVLDPSLELTLEQLNTSNFKRFLWRVWEVVVDIFAATVMRNTERRRANYFGGVHSILEATLHYFSPANGKGFDVQTAMTPVYTSLIELLENLRMSTESLIAKYYQERYDEQMENILPCKASLYVKILFTRPGKLIVEVIMAKDMVVEADSSSITSRGGGLGGHGAHQPVDSYVKVQLVPQEWFPAAAIRKTKTQRKQDPAVYEETFEYDLRNTDDGVRAGFLLLTLKDYNLGFSNTFIGEAVVPLCSLPCVDSSEVHTVANTCFTMTSPGLDIGYKSLRALQFRTGDKVATSFAKKVSKRQIEPKAKTNTALRAEDEKARSRSPNLKERLKLS